MYLQAIDIWYKEVLALSNQQRLTCRKINPNTNQNAKRKEHPETCKQFIC